MNKVVTILSFAVVVGYANPDVSWAGRHVLASPEEKGHSLMLAEHDEFVGPVLRNEGLSQRAEQLSWNWLSLAHTDAHHLPGKEQHHPASYRNSNASDGTVIMFGWAF